MSGVTFEYMEKYLRDLIPDRNDELKELEDFATLILRIPIKSGSFLY